MGVYKKNNRWIIDYYLPSGKRKREVVTIPGVDPAQINREDAKKALSIRKAELAQGKFDIAQTKKPIPLKKLCNEYLNEHSKQNKRSWKRDEVTIKHFLQTFGDKNINQLNSFLITRYRNERSKSVKKSTVNRELDTIRNMFNKAVEWGYIDKSPYKGVEKYKVNNTNLRILSNEEFKLLYNAASTELKTVLLMALNTGMRLGEILSLKLNDINLTEGHLLVRDSKNYDSRYIPIHPELKQVLKQLKESSNSEYVFSHADGTPVKSIKKGFRSALKRSGIDHCRFHDLRHTFASNLVMNGVDLVTVSQLMGHKDLTMTKRYSHPTPEHKKQAIESLKFNNLESKVIQLESVEKLANTNLK